MMLHKKSNPARMWKLLLLAPIVALTLVANAETVTDVVYADGTAPVDNMSNAEEQFVAPPSANETETADTDNDKQAFVAKGIVYDFSEDIPTPIVGAVVRVAGTKRGTVTDSEGKFKLEVSNGSKLEVSYVGYETTIFAVSKAFSEQGQEYKIGLRKSGSGDERPFDVVEDMPKFPGGSAKLFEYLAKSVKYPAAAEKAGVQGRVIATFVVEKDGSISDIKIVRSVSPELDAEAVRVIKAMPNWEPGKQNGKAVHVKYTVPVTFALQGRTTESMKVIDKVEVPNLLSEMVVVGYGKTDEATSKQHPLVVVDGKVVDYSYLKSVDSHAIEHIEVLKDKSATDKYGEKAKNGVIVITTKK